MFQLFQVATTAGRPFVDDQVVARNEMDGEAEKCTCHPVLPRFRKLNSADVRQDVYTNRRNANLVGHILTREIRWNQSVFLQRRAKFGQGAVHAGGVFR